MSTARKALVWIAVAAVFFGFALNQSGTAAPIEASWSLYERANTTSFEPGTGPAAAPSGYEIISFDAIGVSAGPETYMYSGADLPPAQGGPVPPIVGCTATIGGSVLDLDVSGGFPYSGCVFFVGVRNLGELPIRFDLGTLDAGVDFECNVAGCAVTDLDVVAGNAGPNPLGACLVNGAPVVVDGDQLALPAGSLVVCPVFIVVLQPAKEGAVYSLSITPPPLDPIPGERDPVTIRDTPPVFNPGRPAATATEAPAEASPVASSTTSPTVTLVEGERTPGTTATPIAPSTGNAVIQRADPPSASPVGALFVVAGLGLLILAAWPRREH